jgi:putative hemolysin
LRNRKFGDDRSKYRDGFQITSVTAIKPPDNGCFAPFCDHLLLAQHSVVWADFVEKLLLDWRSIG